MKCKDYLAAARRHKKTCELLKATLDGGCVEESHLKNLYYLSGYIIECSVKFGILKLYGHPRDQDVVSFSEYGLTFDSHLKHHRFNRYDVHLQRFCIQAPLIDKSIPVDSEVKALYREWDSVLRYYCQLKYSQKIYLEFFKKACDIMSKIVERAH